MLLEFSKAVLNKCVAIDLPLLRAIQESALRSLGFVCHINTLIWFIKASSSTSVPCGSCLTKTQITPLDCLAQVAWIFVVRPPPERPIPFRLRSLFLRLHCADWLETILLPIWTYLWSASVAWTSKNVARGYTHSSSFEECVFPKVARAFGHVTPRDTDPKTEGHLLYK